MTQPKLPYDAVFVGVARNCAPYLTGVLDNLSRFAQLYRNAAFAFVISDSSDETAAILTEWVDSRDNGAVIDLGRTIERLPKRTARLAHARNRGLAEIRCRTWNNFRHVVVSDLDDVMHRPISAAEFENAARWMEAEPERAGIFANATPRYYDIWALRHQSWCPDDCWHAIWGRPDSESFCATKMREVHKRQVAIPPSAPPIPVRSAFGGLAIYKAHYIAGANYVVDEAAKFESSEHVGFNEQIVKAGGKLFIVPGLVVSAPLEHLFQPSEMPYYLQLEMHRQEFEEKRGCRTFSFWE